MGHFQFRHLFPYLGIDPEEIGVLTPHKAQIRAIRELLKAAKLSDISVGSAEVFQGQVWPNLGLTMQTLILFRTRNAR
jgi:hypothetical protein